MKQRLLGLIFVFVSSLLFPLAVLAQDSVATPQPRHLATPQPPPPPQVITHTVIAGQTLYTIAALYDVSINDLLRLNNLTTESLLSIGQELIVSGVVPLALGVERVTDAALLNLPDMPPVPKIYQVQAGDTLFSLADRFGLSVETLQLANGFSDETVLQLGMTVYIPNQTGDLFARNYAVQVGDTLALIAARFNTTEQKVLEQSGLINPNYLIAGQQVRLVSRTGSAEPQPVFGRNHSVKIGETLSTIAARYNQPPQMIARLNQLAYPTTLVVGQQLRIAAAQPYQPLPTGLSALSIGPLPLRQGETFSVYIETNGTTVTPTGQIKFNGLITATQPWFNTDYEQQFAFFPYADGLVGLFSLDAFAQPGLYQFNIFLDDPRQPAFSQGVVVDSINFGFQNIPVADDMALRAREGADLAKIYRVVSAEPLWDSDQPFRPPLDNIDYRSAGYGAPRSYAGAPVRIFHTGVDYAAPANTPIKAAAAGKIVFSDLVGLHGNHIIIDHGWGVMTAYSHMSQRAVSVGEMVEAGQVIGAIGSSGLSTGTHLHWEVRVRGTPVNGLQWLEQVMPAR